jgi:hypothetical protein
MKRALALSVSMVLGACGDGAVPPALTPSLSQPVVVTADAPTADSQISVEALRDPKADPVAVTLTVRGLQLLLHTGARARLNELSVPLGDATIPASALPPSGLALRDVQIGLEEAIPLAVISADEGTVALHAAAPLKLTWSLVEANGAVHPLGPAVTAPVALDVTVERDPSGAATARLSARCDGTCWSLDPLATFADGVLVLESPADIQFN